MRGSRTEGKIAYSVASSGSLMALSADIGGVRTEYPMYADGEWAMHFELLSESGSVQRVPLAPSSAPNSFSGSMDGWVLHLEYDAGPGSLCLTVQLTNCGNAARDCRLLRFVTGIDTYMEKYPDYMEKVFPSTLQYEIGHFWGLFGSPSGKWLAVVSPDAVDSFKVHYNPYGACYALSAGYKFKDGGHQVDTVSLDLLSNAENLPLRFQPQSPVFAPGEQREWRIYMIPLADEEELGPAVARYAHAPTLFWRISGGAPGECALCDLYSPEDSPAVWGGDAPDFAVEETAKLPGVLRQVCRVSLPDVVPGTDAQWRITAGKHSIYPRAYVRGEWERYVHAASAFASSTCPPFASLVCESSMPAFSLITAERLAPSGTRRARIEGFLRDELFQVSFSPDGVPITRPERIQNQASAIDLCREMFLATGDLHWLRTAEVMAERFIGFQGADGGYYAHAGKQHYTCVIYPAKSLMDLVSVLTGHAAAADDVAEKEHCKQVAGRIMRSVSMAMEDLCRRGEDVGTEGTSTYEDGAISCAALQLAQYAVVSGDKRFSDMAERLMDGHRCLEWRGGDAVTNGATIRFWESYWAMGWHNFFNTPHGWSAWTAFAWHNIYLATGNLKYMHRFMSCLNACLHLVDIERGKVYFCYTPEPVVCNNRNHLLAGELMVNMEDASPMGEGGRETHEIVKLLSDTVLYNAYIYRDSGEWHGVNVLREDGRLVPSCKRISRVYVNTGGEASESGPALSCSDWEGVEIVRHPVA